VIGVEEGPIEVELQRESLLEGGEGGEGSEDEGSATGDGDGDGDTGTAAIRPVGVRAGAG